jgi:hypothetical protein
MSYSNLSDKDRLHMDDLDAITHAYRQVNRPHRSALKRPARALKKAACDWLESAATRATSHDFIQQTLSRLPAPVLALITAPTTASDTWQSIWQDRVRRYAKAADSLPKSMFHLDDAELDQLIDLGFTYDLLLSAEDAATLWLTRGAKYGKSAFRRHFPRKSPAVVYWSSKRTLFPDQGLHHDGVIEMASEIRRWSGKSLPCSVSKNTPFGTGKHDWRVVLALRLHNVLPPKSHQFHMRPSQTFGEELSPRVVALTCKPKSAHHQIKQMGYRKKLPSLEDLLALPIDTERDYLDAFLPKVTT